MNVSYDGSTLQLGRFDLACLTAIECVASETDRSLDEVLDGIIQNDKPSILICFYCLITNKSEIKIGSYLQFVDKVTKNPFSKEDWDSLYIYILQTRTKDLILSAKDTKKKINQTMIKPIIIQSLITLTLCLCFLLITTFI